MEPAFEEHWAQAWGKMYYGVSGYCVMRFASIVEETKM